MEKTLEYFRRRCKDLKMCLDTCRDKDALKKVIAHNEKAVEALEKQIPKKPPLVKRSITQFYACPHCSTGEHYEMVFPKMKYCTNCGQRLDWSENQKD